MRQAMRREVPSTVGLLPGPREFAAMRDAYTTFLFDDHAQYLRRTQGLLRSLDTQGIHVRVVLFDPAEFADYCAATGRDPDTPASRARYTAEVAAGGVTVPYHGQPLGHLVAELRTATDHHTTWTHATDVLVRAGHDPEPFLEHATTALTALLTAAGPGTHHLVCSVPLTEPPLTAALHAHHADDGTVHLPEADALVLCTVLAAALAHAGPGGLVLRTTGTPDRHVPDRVRGWTVTGDGLRPLTEGEVFDAYCTDPRTGDPIPPEPGVEYTAGIPLPPLTG
ncbi:hypothetical protein SCATT_07280 [Streptantibioticus cattleyicolor NRRL 8057 = DSM 46488]|uniref:Uncharacterized protein n=2 Tax=Kitasatosporales TaxID=85011 RepID=G8WW06_STREN|nr:hypothetical protein SCATT_07280 [Streptantibioticus cattleyicolor NRRL 8057 = DSM 46488]